MGCDIHLHAEVKINGQWYTYATPAVPRSYALFTKLAGVRDAIGVAPISPPRGMPEDASVVARANCAYWDSDGHSHSFVTAAEIAEVYRFLKADFRLGGLELADWFGWFLGNHYDWWARCPEETQTHRQYGVEDLRWVFWFDN